MTDTAPLSDQPTVPPRIFLSCASGDRPRARRLAEALRRQGYVPVLAEDEVRAGDSASDVLERCLRDSEAGVLCLSREAMESEWTQEEFRRVLQRFKAGGPHVVAVRFERVHPRQLPGNLRAIDLLAEPTSWERGVFLLANLGEDLPPHNILPAEPSAFTGRESELRLLREALEPRADDKEGRRATLTGNPGMGKTAIAVQFARREAALFPGGIWWGQAQGRPTDALTRLYRDLRQSASLSLLIALDSVEPTASSEEIARGMQRVLGDSADPMLVVLDDVDAPGWSELLPRGRVSVLMTVRELALAEGKVIPVDALPFPQAVQLTDALAPPPSEPDEREARDRVIRLVDGVPLAVYVFAHLARESSWRALEHEALAQADESEHPFAALVLSRMLDRCAPPERLLLEAVAIFADASVPTEWLAATTRLDGLVLRRGLEGLSAKGLVSLGTDGTTVALHPLLRKGVRQRMDASTQELLTRQAVHTVHDWLGWWLVTFGPEQLREIENHRPHLMALLEAAERQVNPEMWLRLAVGSAWVAESRWEFTAARNLLDRARARAEQLADRSYLFSCLVALARVLQRMGEEDLAGAHAKRAVELIDALPDRQDPMLGGDLNDLASVLRSHDAVIAKGLSIRAAQSIERAFGPNDERTAVALVTAALATLEVDGPVAALPLGRRAVDIVERAPLRDASKAAQIMSAMSNILEALGDLTGARAHIERAVTIDERVLPPDHPQLAQHLAKLAFFLMESREFSSARPLLERAAGIQEGKPGLLPELAKTLHNLGAVLLLSGEFKEAEEMLARALILKEQHLPPDDPSLASTRLGLAAAARARGDRKAEAGHLERAMDAGFTIYSPAPGAGEQALAKALRLARGRQVNAAAYVDALSQALEAAEAQGDKTNAARAALLMGAHLGRQGAWESARTQIERGLKLARQAEQPALIAESYRLLGDSCLHGSRYEDARQSYAEAIRRYDELGFALRAARTRALLLAMLLQVGRTDGIEADVTALRRAVDEGTITDAVERAEMLQVLRLADDLLRATSRETPR